MLCVYSGVTVNVMFGSSFGMVTKKSLIVFCLFNSC